MFTWLPKFEIYLGGGYAGCISKEFTFLKPVFDIDYNGWRIEGDFFEWAYTILNSSGSCIAQVSKELFNWTDTYVIDVNDPQDALGASMLLYFEKVTEKFQDIGINIWK